MVQETTIVDQTTAMADIAFEPRTVLLNTYEVEKALASGGMGEVFLVRHMELDTRHAIKVIRPELLDEPQVMALFRREANVLRTINHDAVVGYEGFFRDARGACYLVMEYVDGPSLAQVMAQRKLSVAEIYTLRDRLARGLAAAHAKGVIHRDLSPDNIILPAGKIENAKLIDFGIAKLTDKNVDTIVGDAFAGKVRYASPEQLRLYGGKVDVCSDIYSLALVLAAAVCGEPLYMGHSVETAILARKSVPNLGSVPKVLRAQFEAMLKPQPEARPQSLDAVLSQWPKPRPAEESARTLSHWFGVGLSVVVVVAVVWLVITTVLHDDSDNGVKNTDAQNTDAQNTDAQNTDAQNTDAQNADAQNTEKNNIPQTIALAELALRPSQEIYEAAQQIFDQGRMDDALALWEQAWSKSRHGYSALAIGALYDPVNWNENKSPFSKPNPRQAEKWFQRAADAGVAEAGQRLERLRAWRSR